MQGGMTDMKINESIGIAYSGIRQNSGEKARQNVPKELEKKMGQYKDPCPSPERDRRVSGIYHQLIR